MPLIPRVGAAAHTPPRRRINLAMSITARECDPTPISRSPSVARTRNSIRRPSILVTSASPVTMLPTTVGARWRTLISVPTALSLGSLGLDDEGEGALGSRRYLPQGMPPYVARASTALASTLAVRG